MAFIKVTEVIAGKIASLLNPGEVTTLALGNGTIKIHLEARNLKDEPSAKDRKV